MIGPSDATPHLPRRLPAVGHLGWTRGAFGGALGILLAGAVTWVLLGRQGVALPFLIAPLGASTVLVFCVPASPLAQPWSVLGGNLTSAALGLAVGHLFGNPWIAGSVAVGLAIAVMSLLRCLHPPGGACALLCAIEATGPAAWDATMMLPITANVLVLCGFGWLYNNLTGHPWPHVAPTTPQPVSIREDVEAVLEEWDEVLDVDAEDLEAFVQAVLRRRRLS